MFRLLADDSGSVLKWQLVYNETVGVVPYLTLSHCWGGSSQKACLTKSNRSGCLQPSAVTCLPKTYRDALTIAHFLGFEFMGGPGRASGIPTSNTWIWAK